MLEPITVLILLGSLFLLIIIVAIYMRSKGQRSWDVPTKRKFSSKEALTFIIGFLIVILFAVYQKGHNF